MANEVGKSEFEVVQIAKEDIRTRRPYLATDD